MAIEGIAAFSALVDTSSLRVASRQSANLPDRPSGSALLISDTINLSAGARAILALQARQIPLGGGGTSLTADKAAPGNLIRGDFSSRSFVGNDLTGIVLNFANLRDTDFTNAVLRDASLANADVSGATFFGTDLRGANLAGATGLTANQLIGARVDISTILPIGVLLE